MEPGKVATAAAVFISSTAIFFALIFTSKMYTEVSEMYTEMMAEIHQFNNLTNDAWNEMMAMQHQEKTPEAEKNPFKSFFRKGRDAGLPEHCHCGLQPNNCPPGRPGPPGPPGSIGIPGAPGGVGRAGISGQQLADVIYQKACILCPAGAAGPPGPPGAPGVPGANGADGVDGAPSPPGTDGAPGEPGDAGEGGPDGLPGAAGSPGAEGVRSIPGPRGPQGPVGEPGDAGEPGLPGLTVDGEPGEAGEPGAAGGEGLPGPRGRAGSAGTQGIPGQDGQYCPCPARGAYIAPPDAKETYEPNVPEAASEDKDDDKRAIPVAEQPQRAELPEASGEAP